MFPGQVAAQRVPRHEGGGSFVAVELIGHLLLRRSPSRKSMFRKSMGSGDNGKPHKRGRTWEPGVRKEVVLRAMSSPLVFCPKGRKHRCEAYLGRWRAQETADLLMVPTESQGSVFRLSSVGGLGLAVF